jgi:hypothetical protein
LSQPETAPGQEITLIVDEDLAYTEGTRVRVFDRTAGSYAFLEGEVKSYSGNALVILIDKRSQDSTLPNDSWNVNLAGLVGATGPEGATGPQTLLNGEPNQLLRNKDGFIEGTQLYYTSGEFAGDPDRHKLGIGVIDPAVSLDVSGQIKTQGTHSIYTVNENDPHGHDNTGLLWTHPLVTGMLVMDTDIGTIFHKPSPMVKAHSFVGDGTVTSFALGTSPDYRPPPGSEYLIVSIDGLVDPPEDYEIVQSTASNTQSSVSYTSTDFIDSSSSNKPIYPNGDVEHKTEQSQLGNSSIYFDGTGDWLEVSTNDDPDWDFGDENWTMEAWVRPTAAYSTIMGKWNTAGQSDNSFVFWIDDNDHKIRGYFQNDCTATDAGVILYGTIELTLDDSFYHIAIQRNGDRIELFVDGVYDTRVDFTDNMCTSTQPFMIGDFYLPVSSSQTPREYKGYIDEIRISSKARYPALDVYTQLPAGFTPSSVAFQNDSDTLLLIHSNYSEAGEDPDEFPDGTYVLKFDNAPQGNIDVRSLIL